MRTIPNRHAPRRRTRRGLPLAVAAMLAAACGAPAIDLAALLPEAGAHTESADIDLGTAGTRQFLLSGWAPGDEWWMGRPEDSFVWGLSGGVQLEAWILHRGQRTMTIRLRPHVHGEDVPVFQRLRATFNGNPLPEVDVVAGWQELEFPVPERFQQIGPNLIALGYDGPPGPPADAADPTTFRIAVDWVRLSELRVTALPRRSVGAAAELVLPYLSAADFTLTLRPGASIDLGSVRVYGRPVDGIPRLLVRIATSAGTRTIELPVPADEFLRPPPVAIDVPADGTVRLSLIASPPDSYLLLQGQPFDADAGIRLVQPRVHDGR